MNLRSSKSTKTFILKILFFSALMHTEFAHAVPPATPDKDMIAGVQAVSNLNEDPNACITQNRIPLPTAGGTLDVSKKDITAEFCVQVTAACKKSTGSPYCLPNAVQVNSHIADWTHLADQVNGLHQKYTSSQAVQNLCCKDNQDCRKNFIATKVVVELQPSGAHHLTDEFDIDSQTIYLSAKTLSFCASVECIEEIYLHELGHACQQAIVLGSKPDAVDSFGVCTNRPEPTLETYKHYFGAKASCVFQKVKAQYDKTKFQDVCIDGWYQEAMASTIFSSLFRSPMNFQRTCNSASDQIHPKMDSMIGCMDLH